MDILKANAILNNNEEIKGNNVKTYKKIFNDIKEEYLDDTNFNLDTLMYEVYSYENNTPSVENLNFGLTVLYPIYVNNECNFTKGHWHENRKCAEFYQGVSGKGLLLLMDENGKTWSEEVHQGSIHYIDGKLAHRLVNVGDDKLVVSATWSPSAGHDYDAVKNCPFKYRIFKIDNKLIIKERN